MCCHVFPVPSLPPAFYARWGNLAIFCCFRSRRPGSLPAPARVRAARPRVPSPPPAPEATPPSPSSSRSPSFVRGWRLSSPRCVPCDASLSPWSRPDALLLPPTSLRDPSRRACPSLAATSNVSFFLPFARAQGGRSICRGSSRKGNAGKFVQKSCFQSFGQAASGKARANSSDAAAQEGGESDTGGRTMSVSKGVGIPVKLLHEAEGHIVTVSRGGDLVLRAGGRALLGPRPPSDLPTNRCGQAEQRSHSDERRLSPFLLAARTQVELKTGETFRGTLKVSDAACGSAPFRSDRRAAEVRPRPLSSSPGLTGASHPPLHSLVRAFRTPRTIGTASLRMSRPRRG